MSSVTNKNAHLDQVLIYARSCGIDPGSIEGPLAAILVEGDPAPNLTWARDRGAEHARQGAEVSAVVRELFALANTIVSVRPYGTDAGDLPTALVSAGVEGYLSCRATM